MTADPSAQAAPTREPTDGAVSWDAERRVLRVRDPRMAGLLLRDPHIITGVQRSRPSAPVGRPGDGRRVTVPEFFEMWYTVGDQYEVVSRELRKAFTPRAVASLRPTLQLRARRVASDLPVRGDLVTAYLGPYLRTSTFALLGVPEAEWPNLDTVSRLVVHLFKERLRGETDHGERLEHAFDVSVRYLLRLSHRLRTGDEDTPFLTAVRTLREDWDDDWPIAALLGQLVMAGIEPMIAGASVAVADLWRRPEELAEVRAGRGDLGAVVDDSLQRRPPFRSIFRFVDEPCDCLGIDLAPGTLLAIDIAAVHDALARAAGTSSPCPVRPGSAFTFGRGEHVCLGAHSARAQLTIGVGHLVRDVPHLTVDHDGIRMDTTNNLREIRALPYALG